MGSLQSRLTVCDTDVIDDSPVSTHTYTYLDHPLAEELTCGICLNLFTNAVDTQCRHTFCYECLNYWFQTANAAKVCLECGQALTRDWRNTSNGNTLLIAGRVLVDKNRKVDAMVAKLNTDTRLSWAPNRSPQTRDDRTVDDLKREIMELKRTIRDKESECHSLTQIAVVLEAERDQMAAQVLQLNRQSASERATNVFSTRWAALFNPYRIVSLFAILLALHGLTHPLISLHL